MAEEPLIKLDEETKARLTNLQTDISKAERAIQTMKKVGMDTKMIEDKLEWAKEVRKTILEEFE